MSCNTVKAQYALPMYTEKDERKYVLQKKGKELGWSLTSIHFQSFMLIICTLQHLVLEWNSINRVESFLILPNRHHSNSTWLFCLVLPLLVTGHTFVSILLKISLTVCFYLLIHLFVIERFLMWYFMCVLWCDHVIGWKLLDLFNCL